MSNPICVKCEVEFRPEKNGIYVQEMCHEDKETYKVWCADKWKCPICGAEIVVGFATNPLFGNWNEDCKERTEKLIASGAVIIRNYEQKRKEA